MAQIKYYLYQVKTNNGMVDYVILFNDSQTNYADVVSAIDDEMSFWIPSEKIPAHNKYLKTDKEKFINLFSDWVETAELEPETIYSLKPQVPANIRWQKNVNDETIRYALCNLNGFKDEKEARLAMDMGIWCDSANPGKAKYILPEIYPQVFESIFNGVLDDSKEIKPLA